MYNNARFYEDAPSGAGGEFFIWLFIFLIVAAVISGAISSYKFRARRKEYLNLQPNRGYELELFQSRSGNWGWLVTYRLGKEIEHQNLASYKQSPYSDTYHENRENAEKEAMLYISSLGFSSSEVIKFNKFQ